jgi:hypothetical protein
MFRKTQNKRKRWNANKEKAIEQEKMEKENG